MRALRAMYTFNVFCVNFNLIKRLLLDRITFDSLLNFQVRLDVRNVVLNKIVTNRYVVPHLASASLFC